MTVTNIPDNHHVIRHCKNSQYYLHNGKIRPHPEAFHLRAATATYPAEDTLSGVYYEWFDGDAAEKLRASCYYISVSMKRKDALLQLNAGLVKAQGMARSTRLRVTHEPDRTCEPYAAIRGLPQLADNQLCVLLAALTVINAVDFASIANP